MTEREYEIILKSIQKNTMNTVEGMALIDTQKLKEEISLLISNKEEDKTLAKPKPRYYTR